MIKIHLPRLLGEKRWSQARLARVTGICPSTISHWYNEFIDQVSLDHLDRICEALGCEVIDLLEYIPNNLRHTGGDLIIEEHGNRKHR